MKKLALLFALLTAVPSATFAQDDVYFIPSKDVTPERNESSYSPIDESETEPAPTVGYYTDSQIDQYNRRGEGVEEAAAAESADLTDTAAIGEGSMTQRLIRFHAPEVNVYVSSPYYWDYYYDPVWYYSPYWRPCYSWSFGWAWGGPYWSWGWGGWYDPFWGPSWGWGGWYDPFWRPPYWHHPLPPHHGPGFNPRPNAGRTIAGYTGRTGRNYGSFGSTGRGGSPTYLRPSNNFGGQRRPSSGVVNRNPSTRPSNQSGNLPTRTYNNSNTQTRPSSNRSYTPSRSEGYSRPSGSRSYGSPVISGGGRSYGGGGGMRGGGSRGGRR